MTTASAASILSPSDPSGALLRARGLSKRYPVGSDLLGRPRAWLSAVDDVDLDIPRHGTLGVVGETGSGKSTLGQLLTRLVDASAGTVDFDGIDVLAARGRVLAQLRQRIQIVFQDPYSSLNPRMRVGAIVAEGLSAQPRAERAQRAAELLDLIGLGSAVAGRYPHMLSGGQRQRVALARALAVQPELIILDEPVSALDVSVQSQILNLLGELSENFGHTYLFITHDLSVVRHIADRIAVMYLGKIVELADVEELFAAPRHPYTVALLSAMPGWRRAQRARRITLEGDIPSPIDPPPGCRFASRCPRVLDRCRVETPPLTADSDAPTHTAACFNPFPPTPA
jgi:oligopeptide/dipeptide ABC transporter ATP-binding protein